MQKTEQIAASSVPLSLSSSGTDEASQRWNKYCIGESVHGRRFGGWVVDANIVMIGNVGPNVRTWERENFEYGGQTKKRKKGRKGPLDNFLRDDCQNTTTFRISIFMCHCRYFTSCNTSPKFYFSNTSLKVIFALLVLFHFIGNVFRQNF